MKLRDRDPKKHKGIIDELKQGRTIREVAVKHDVSPSTVMLIKTEIPPHDIPSHKRRMSDKFAVALELLSDRLIEEAKTAKGVRDISIAVGIVQDKKALLDGEGHQTLRIEHVQLPDTNALIALLPSAKVLQVETKVEQMPVNIEVASGSHNRSTANIGESDPGAGVDDVAATKTTTD